MKFQIEEWVRGSWLPIQGEPCATRDEAERNMDRIRGNWSGKDDSIHSRDLELRVVEVDDSEEPTMLPSGGPGRYSRNY